MQDDSGVLFVVTGQHFTQAAAEAARSVKKTNPWLKTAIFTDQDVASAPFDIVHRIENTDARTKHEFVGRSPFHHTLYLDSDIRVTSDLRDLFRVLEKYEMAGAHVRFRDAPKRLKKHTLDIPEAFPQINCGVLLYRKCPNVDALFEAWRAAYKAGGFTRDQTPFREVLWQSDVKFHVLAPEYNKRDIPFSPLSREPLPKILHIKGLHSRKWLVRAVVKILLWPTWFRLWLRKD